MLDVLGLELPYPPFDWNPPGLERLRRFHLHYGEEVLALARAQDVAAAAAAVAAWIEGNRAHAGDGWHPYTVSTRVGNWIAAASLEPELLTPPLSESLWYQLSFLSSNVEDEILGNHLIRNGRALVLGGVAFGVDALVEQGLALLLRELPEQVLSDGGHYERSPVYHLIVLRDLLEVRAVTRAAFLEPVVDRMSEFAVALARPDGAPALFNDGSLDLAPELGLPSTSRGVSCFAECGYVTVRQDDLWLAFDCGPVGPVFLPAHAHADALSFQLWLEGEPVVIDPGTWTYEPGPERDLLRSTAVHSTVTVDGGSQFEPWGAFRSGPLPQVELIECGESAASALVRWKGGVVHRRTITWGRDAVVVSDQVEGRGRHAIASRLPIADGAATRVDGDFEIEQGRRSEHLYAHQEGDVLVRRAEGVLPLELEWRLRR